jgi:zinc and cadmium transporter
MLLSILAATLFVSSLAFFTASLLSIFPQLLRRMLPSLIALAAGTMLGTTFLHLLPEAVAEIGAETALPAVLASFIGFFLLEKILHWRHCHDEECETHTFGTLNLIGDAVHNFLDGALIAVSFQIDPALGISTTLAVALHELPQEIGDFGVLVHSGFSPKQALLANFGVALTAISGGLAGYLLGQSLSPVLPYLLPFAAGSFLYIAAVDLIPELRSNTKNWQTLFLPAIFIFGVLLIPLLEKLIGLDA